MTSNPRVRVTGPARAPGTRRATQALREIDAQSDVGEVYLRSLMRAQLRLSIGVLACLAAVVSLLPAVFWIAPNLTGGLVLGVPLSWAILAVGTYPALVALGWLFVRRAERNEAAFTDLVERD